MKIFMDDRAWNHSAGVYLREEWNRLGYVVESVPTHADVQVSFTYIQTDTFLPTVVRFDNVYFHTGFNYLERNRRISKHHAVADGVVYQSYWSKAVHEAFCSPRKKDSIYSIIYNGMREGWNGVPIEHNGFNIMTASIWRRFKRLPEMIKVFNILHKKLPQAKLYIFGRFSRSEFVSMEYPGVTYCGDVPHSTLGEHYKYGDLFWHFSKGESCPRAVVEAIASGMPAVVLNDSGGAVEMIDDECGVVIDCCTPFPEDKSKIVQNIYTDEYAHISEPYKIIDWVSSFIESPYRAKLPEKLNITYTAKQYIDIMKKVLER